LLYTALVTTEKRKEIKVSRLRRFGFALVACVPVICAAVWVPAQQAAGPPATEPPTVGMNADEGRRIDLNVQVTDKAGNPVRGLTRQDFTLLVNKQPAPIVAFHAYSGAAQSSDPPQVLVVLDATNMDFLTVQRSEVGIDRFLRENGRHLVLPTSVVVSDDNGVRGDFDPATNGNAVADHLKKIQTHFRAISATAGRRGAAVQSFHRCDHHDYAERGAPAGTQAAAVGGARLAPTGWQ
jgi:hypothetical protein